MGITFEKKESWDGKREQIRFKQLSDEEKAALIAKDPALRPRHLPL